MMIKDMLKRSSLPCNSVFLCKICHPAGSGCRVLANLESSGSCYCCNKGQRLTCIFDGDCCLKEGHVGCCPWQVQLLHEALKGHVSMSQGHTQHLLTQLQQLPNTTDGPQLKAQGQHMVGIGAADDDVFLATGTADGQGKCRQQQIIDGGAVVLGKGRQLRSFQHKRAVL